MSKNPTKYNTEEILIPRNAAIFPHLSVRGTCVQQSVVFSGFGNVAMQAVAGRRGDTPCSCPSSQEPPLFCLPQANTPLGFTHIKAFIG